MPSVMKAVKGKTLPSKAMDIIIDSNLTFNERLEQSRLFGEFYPVMASMDSDDDLIRIDFDIPRIRTETEEKLDSAPAQVSIKHRNGDIYSISLKIDGFGQSYNDYIMISDDIMDILRDSGDSSEICAVFNVKASRLMGLLYDNGDYINFMGDYVEEKGPWTILELVGQGAEAQLPEHEAEESEAKLLEYEVIDIGAGHVKNPRKGFNKSFVVSKEKAMWILGKTRDNFYNFTKKYPNLVKEDGSMTHESLAIYGIGSKGTKMNLEKRTSIFKKIGLSYEEDDPLGSAAKLLRSYGIDVEPGVEFSVKAGKKPRGDSGYEHTGDFLSETLDLDEISNILGIRKGSVYVNIHKGDLRDRSRGSVLKRINAMKRKTEEQKLEMYNKALEGTGRVFYNISEVRDYISSKLKKKLV